MFLFCNTPHNTNSIVRTNNRFNHSQSHLDLINKMHNTSNTNRMNTINEMYNLGYMYGINNINLSAKHDTRKVTFSRVIEVILIPHYKDYIEAGLFESIWNVRIY